MPNPPSPKADARWYFLMDRVSAYTKLFQAGKIEGFEWFCLTDPFEHIVAPGINPMHQDEIEFQKEFSARLDRFFEEETPGLPHDRVLQRLDELVKEQLEKEHGEKEPWAILRKGKP